MAKKNPYDMDYKEFQKYLTDEGITSQQFHSDQGKPLFQKYLKSKSFKNELEKDKKGNLKPTGKIVPIESKPFDVTTGKVSSTKKESEEANLKSYGQPYKQAKGGKVKKKKKAKKSYVKKYAKGGGVRKVRA
mgnify:FL=1